MVEGQFLKVIEFERIPRIYDNICVQGNLMCNNNAYSSLLLSISHACVNP